MMNGRQFLWKEWKREDIREHVLRVDVIWDFYLCFDPLIITCKLKNVKSDGVKMCV